MQRYIEKGEVEMSRLLMDVNRSMDELDNEMIDKILFGPLILPIPIDEAPRSDIAFDDHRLKARKLSNEHAPTILKSMKENKVRRYNETKQ